jgi:hypothetical protein
VFGHMSEVDVPIFTGLAAAELMEGLAEMESALGFAWSRQSKPPGPDRWWTGGP